MMSLKIKGDENPHKDANSWAATLSLLTPVEKRIKITLVFALNDVVGLDYQRLIFTVLLQSCERHS